MSSGRGPHGPYGLGTSGASDGGAGAGTHGPSKFGPIGSGRKVEKKEGGNDNVEPLTTIIEEKDDGENDVVFLGNPRQSQSQQRRPPPQMNTIMDEARFRQIVESVSEADLWSMVCRTIEAEGKMIIDAFMKEFEAQEAMAAMAAMMRKTEHPRSSISRMLAGQDFREALHRHAQMLQVPSEACKFYNTKESNNTSQMIAFQLAYSNFNINKENYNRDEMLALACRTVRRLVNPWIATNDDYRNALTMRALSSYDMNLIAKWIRYDVPRYAEPHIPKFHIYNLFAKIFNYFETALSDYNLYKIPKLERPASTSERRNRLLNVTFDCMYALGMPHTWKFPFNVDKVFGTMYRLVKRDSPYRLTLMKSDDSDRQWTFLGEINMLTKPVTISGVDRDSLNFSSGGIFPELYPSILQFLVIDPNGHLRARRLIQDNQLLLREPILAMFPRHGANFCSQCFAIVGSDFVPCDKCTYRVFCSKLCERMSKMPMIGRHRTPAACTQAFINQRLLSKYSEMIIQLVNAIGGADVMKKAILRCAAVNEEEQQKIPFLIRDWWTETEDYNIFAILAIFSSCEMSRLPLSDAMLSPEAIRGTGVSIATTPDTITDTSETIPVNNLNADDRRNSIRCKADSLLEATTLAATLFDDISPSIVETLYRMLMFLRHLPHARQSVPDALTKFREPIGVATVLSAFGTGFIRTFRCRGNVACYINAESGTIDYVSVGKITVGELLSCNWPLSHEEQQLPSLMRQRLIASKYGRVCGCKYCALARVRQSRQDSYAYRPGYHNPGNVQR